MKKSNKKISDKSDMHKKENQSVIENGKKFWKTHERITDAFIALDVNWCYTYANKKAGELLSRDPQSIIGKHIWTEFPEGVNHSLYKACYKAMELQETQYLQEYFLPSDKWFENRIYPSPEGLTIYFTDITNQKKAEQALRDSEEKFSKAFHSKVIGMAIINSERKIVEANETFAAILETTRENLLGKTSIETGIFNFDAEDNLEKREEFWAKFKESGKVNNFEIETTLKNGKFIVFLLSIEPIETNTNLQYLITLLEITEKKKAEDDIKISIERFEMITRATNDALWEWNIETGELWANDTHQKLYGLSINDPVPTVEEWLGKIHPGEREKISEKQAQCLFSDKNVFTTEYRFKTNDEGYKYIYDRCYILRNSKGKAVRILSSMMDITDQKNAEEEVRKNEKRFQAMVENNDSIISLLDENFQPIYRTPSAVRLGGWTDNERLKFTLLELVHPNDLKYLEMKKKEILQKPDELVEVSFRMKHKNGNYISIEGVATNLLRDNNVRAIVANIREVTERKKAEEKINQLNRELEQRVKERTEELETANKELEEINELFLGREARIIELKEELENLNKK